MRRPGGNHLSPHKQNKMIYLYKTDDEMHLKIKCNTNRDPVSNTVIYFFLAYARNVFVQIYLNYIKNYKRKFVQNYGRMQISVKLIQKRYPKTKVYIKKEALSRVSLSATRKSSIDRILNSILSLLSAKKKKKKYFTHLNRNNKSFVSRFTFK